MPPQEAQLRDEIVARARALWHRRLASGTSGNLSARLDDGDLLVTPAGRSLATLEPEHLVRVDGSGRARDSRLRPSSELPLHLAAYATRPEILCVVHAHPTFCVVWSALGTLFPADTVGARETLGPVAWAAYREPGSHELAEICAQAFARGYDTVLMERHGLTAIATTFERAFDLTDLAEEAARVAYFTRLLGGTTEGGTFPSPGDNLPA
ncbi:MAG TPA: class II aldolase/adducin family protein [Verrucomicrobiae bacterium]|nr:class II aldolase/adducin family protein [Verrucomicrobiae bacterium]